MPDRNHGTRTASACCPLPIGIRKKSTHQGAKSSVFSRNESVDAVSEFHPVICSEDRGELIFARFLRHTRREEADQRYSTQYG